MGFGVEGEDEISFEIFKVFMPLLDWNELVLLWNVLLLFFDPVAKVLEICFPTLEFLILINLLTING